MDVRFLIAGDRAVSVEFGKVICLEANEKVRMLEEKLKESPIDGVVEVVPTYCSLIVHYRPEVVLYDELIQALQERLDNMHSVQAKKKIVKEIPILYGGETGPDLEYCAQLEQTSTEEIIRKHSEHEYYVYMLGFAPGHPIWQDLRNPFEQPCGWNIIGSTPLDICNFKKEDPFLLSAGDWVRHVPVTKEEYDRIRHDVENGTYQVKTYAANE